MHTDNLEKEIGFVQSTKHYLLSLSGFPSARVHDIIVNEDGQRALVTSLSHNRIEAMALDHMEPKPGTRFTLGSRGHQFSVGEHLLGRVISALGDPRDGKGGFPMKNAALELDVEAPGLAERAPITEQLITGYAMIDTVLPISRGQRQLLMGPVRSGTDVFVREVIKNQAGRDCICIYAAVGKPSAAVREFVSDLMQGPTASYTIAIVASSDDSTPLITIAPSVALFVAEYFMRQGKHVLLVVDDLYTHAKYLREAALLEGRLPGRESYPGDIFYQQAQFIERAGSFKNKGSITFLPILQTDIESYTDLITTNIMGTTDGHLSFDAMRFAQGIFPPVSEDESVTRTGKHAQSVVQKQLSTAIMALLAEAKVQERFSQFGTQLSEAARETVRVGEITRYLLRQEQSEHLSVEGQTILLALLSTVFASGKTLDFFKKNRAELVSAIETNTALQEIRSAVRTESSYEAFLKHLEGSLRVFEQACPN